MTALPAWTKTAAADPDEVLTTDMANQGQGCAVAIVEGAKSIEKLVRYVGASTVTGTQSNYNLDALAVAPAIGIAELRWGGAADVIFTGFTGGLEGRDLIIRNVSASKSLLVKHDVTSTAANRFYTQSTYGQYLGPGGVGRATYDGTVSRWRFECLDPGLPISPAYSSGDYTAVDWTVLIGDVALRAFQQRGRLVHLFLSFPTPTAAGGRAQLDQLIPGGFTTSDAQTAWGLAVNGGPTVNGCWQVFSGSATLRATLVGGANWAAGAIAISGNPTIFVN